MTPRQHFEHLADDYLALPDVTAGTGFGGTAGLRVDGRIFVMLMDAGLVLKLPAARCADLVAAGRGIPFTAGKGRPMREWVVLGTADGGASDEAWEADWDVMVEEAYEFVGHRTQPPG
ncbi:hypothetical protein ACWEOW_16785 [Monashia sp. NPDC004114]